MAVSANKRQNLLSELSGMEINSAEVDSDEVQEMLEVCGYPDSTFWHRILTVSGIV